MPIRLRWGLITRGDGLNENGELKLNAGAAFDCIGDDVGGRWEPSTKRSWCELSVILELGDLAL